MKRHKNDDRRQFFALFEHNEVVIREQMLACFADTKNPAASICVTIKRYNCRLEGARIAQGDDGYRLYGRSRFTSNYEGAGLTI